MCHDDEDDEEDEFEECKQKINIEITSNNPCLEIFLIDSSYNLVNRDVQNLKTKILPGFYSVKYKLGNLIKKENILVKENSHNLTYFAPEILPQSNIPFYKNIDNKNQNQIIDYLKNINFESYDFEKQDIKQKEDFGELFVFINPLDKEIRDELIREDHNVFLNSLDNQTLIDFNKIGYKKAIDKNFKFYSCKIKLKTGTYIFKADISREFCVSQPIIISKGWRTLFFSNYQENERTHCFYWDIAQSSIIMNKINSNLLSLENNENQLVEHTRNALMFGRNKISEALLKKLSKEGFNDPMLGIYALHIMINSKEINLELIKNVYNKTKNIIGNHPDLESIFLHNKLINEFNNKFKFDNYPPMLSSSWNLILKASIEKPDIVSHSSFTGKIRNITSSRFFSWLNISLQDEGYNQWYEHYVSILNFINCENREEFFQILDIIKKEDFRSFLNLNDKISKNLDFISFILEIILKNRKKEVFLYILKNLDNTEYEILEYFILITSKTIKLIRKNLKKYPDVFSSFTYISPENLSFDLEQNLDSKSYNNKDVIKDLSISLDNLLSDFNSNLVKFINIPLGVVKSIIEEAINRIYFSLYNKAIDVKNNGDEELAIIYLELASILPNAEDEVFSDLSFLKKDIEYLKKGLEKYPKSLILNYNMGTLLVYDSKESEAITYFDKALKFYKEDEDIKKEYIYVNLSNTYYNLKNYDNSIKYMEDAYKLDPKNEIVCYNLGTLYGEIKKDYDLAIKYLKESININGNNLDTYTNLAISYSCQKDFHNSELFFKKALKIIENNITNDKENFINITFNYANLLVSKNELDRAKEKYKTCLKYDKYHIPSLVNLSLTFISQNKIRYAIDFLLRALEIDSNNYINLYLIGWCYSNLNEYNISIDYLEKSIRLKENYIDSLFLLSNLYIKQHSNKFIEVSKKLLDIDSEIEDDDLWRIYNNIGSFYIKLNKLSEAKTYLLKSLEINNFSNEVLFNLSICFSLEKDIENLNKYFNRISNKTYINELTSLNNTNVEINTKTSNITQKFNVINFISESNYIKLKHLETA